MNETKTKKILITLLTVFASLGKLSDDSGSVLDKPRRLSRRVLTAQAVPFLLILLAASLGITLARTPKHGLLNHDGRKIVSQQSGEVLGAYTEIRGTTAQPVEKISIAEPINFAEVKAESFLVYDYTSGEDIFEKNSGEPLAIGSLTKLLTGLVAYKNVDLEAKVTITGQDTVQQNPSLGLKVADQVLLHDLFNAMIIGSANDAAQALANAVKSTAGRNFADLMNIEAASLGMKDSHFENPLGFDSSQNYSTAADIKKLVQATQGLDAFSSLAKNRSYSFSGSAQKTYKVSATNKLLKSHPEISAVKTGTTPAAQEAMISKISIQNHPVIVIVLKSPDRDYDTLALEKLTEQNVSWK